MITFRDEDRRSGKTTYIIEELKSNKDWMAAVPTRHIKEKIYPKELHDRVWTFEQLVDDLRGMSATYTGIDSRSIHGIFIDECFMENTHLYRLYYYLGRRGIEVRCFGTSHRRRMENLGRSIRPII